MSMHADYSSSNSIIQCNKNPTNLIQIRKEFKIIKKKPTTARNMYGSNMEVP